MKSAAHCVRSLARSPATRFETFLSDRLDLIQQNRFNLSGIRSSLNQFDRLFRFAGKARFAPWSGRPQAGRNAVQRA